MRHSAILWTVCAAVLAVNALPIASTPLQYLFAVMVIATQATLLCLPLFLLEWSLKGNKRARGSRLLREGALVLVALVLITLLYSNYTLKQIFGFYIDPFVINILTTPGGIEALGASRTFYLSATTTVLAFGLGYAALVWLVPMERILKPVLVQKRWLITLFVATFLAQSTLYALAEYKVQPSVLAIADSVPWYPAVTAGSALEKLGVERPRDEYSLGDLPDTQRSGLPRDPAQVLPLEHRYNILWLVAESWRWDMLDPEIMPATTRFARSSHNFLNHYSSGNGTRMGIFGQFYGLTGKLWFPARHYRVPPLLMEALRQEGYEIDARTSASFTYPEFDQTVWANVPEENLTSDHEGPRWQRDQRNVSGLIDFMQEARSPFMAFMFFESTHANYEFPPENALREDVVEDFNYLDGIPDSGMHLIKNRYVNASNHLDSQFERIFSYLEQSGQLDNTLVIVTGDHGEEFMESGHWGHNSTFSREQIRVPLLLHVPKQGGAIHNEMTSHLDIPSTVLNILNPGASQRLPGMGSDLLAPEYHRDYVIVSDWHGDALVTDQYTLSLSAKANARRAPLSTSDGHPYSGEGMPGKLQSALRDYIQSIDDFSTPKG